MSTEDPLWRALERILSFYHLRADKALAQSQIAIDWNKPLTPADIMLIAGQIGLDVTVHAIAGIDLRLLEKPTCVVQSDSQIIVALPQEDKTIDLWSPDESCDVMALSERKERNLYAIGMEKRLNQHVDGKETTGARWFWELFWKHRRDYVDIGLATFFINIFALITPLFSMNVFDRVVPNHANETLFALTVGMMLAFSFNFGFKYVRGHILGSITANIATKLDVNLMNHLLRLALPTRKLTVGEKFDLFHELQGLRDFFSARLLPAVVDMPFFILFLLVIYVIAPGIAVVVVVGVISLLVVNILGRPAIARAATRHFKDTRNKNSTLVEMLSGAHAIRMFNAIGYGLFQWQQVSERVARSSERNQNATGLTEDLSVTIMYLVSVFVIVIGVQEIEQGELSVGGLIACNILVGRTLSPVMSLASVFGRLRQSIDSLKTIDRVFHMPAEPQLTLEYEPKAPFKGRMKLQDITFYHHGQVHPTLYHLSLDIRPGEKVGIIGRTGAGKSTVTRLLDGSLTPQSGHVFVDDLVISSIHPSEWRGALGIVPQEPFVFSGTMRENILLGVQTNVDETWLQQVLHMSGLDLLMKQAGYGLDFQVGESGSHLSGGQRQSLALARALIRRPQILLLDEPTNGMDNDMEQRVMGALQAYIFDKTMVMITHRTPLLRLVDRLVLIDGGRVTVDGPRDEVMRKLSGKTGVEHG